MTSLLTAARVLVEAVSFDVNGARVGQVYQGGNGGMVSIDTLKACDALRREIEAVETEARRIAEIEAFIQQVASSNPDIRDSSE